MYTIQIIGAGYAGARIAQFFSEKKQKVFALTRSTEKAKEFEKQNIQPIVADLTKLETLSKIPSAHFIVICPAPDVSGEASYEQIYLKGIQNYLNAIQKNPRPSLIVYFSSTGIWQDQVGDCFDESIVPKPISAKAKILVQAEQQILASGYPTVILRLSGIYGPERNRIQAFCEKLWPVAGVDRWMNLIHVDDIAQAMPVIFKNAQAGEIYLGTDDEPVLCSTVASWLAEKIGMENKFLFKKGPVVGRRLKNTKFKGLGIRLKYPSFREGYERELLRAKEKMYE